MFETATAGEYTAETAWNESEYPQAEGGPQGEDEWGRRRWRRRRRWDYYDDDDESEFPAQGAYQSEGQYEDEGEEQFLPLLPLLSSVVPAVLSAFRRGRKREAEAEYEGEDEGEGEEQFILGRLLKGVLGEAPEREDAPVLSPRQEAEVAGQLLEVDSEEELGRLLGGIVNMVGRAVQGVQNAARTPQGRAVIDAVAPVVQAALAGGGGPGEIFEAEVGGMSQEQEVFETARQAVRLTAATAQHVATAPPGAPANLVGELGLLRAAGRLARPLVGRAVRGIFNRPRTRFRPGYRGGYRGYRGPGYGPPYRRHYGYRGRRYWGYRGPRLGYYRYGYAGPGYIEGPPPAPEPVGAPPEPPQPGFRWVAVPIGAPAPAAVPPEPAGPVPPPDAPPPPGPAPGEWEEAPYGEAQYGELEPEYGQGQWEAPMQNGHGDGGRWVRRHGKIELLGA